MRETGLRGHAVFVVALVAGVAARLAVEAAYRPVLLFPDSNGYLTRARDFTLNDMRPAGYQVFLRPFLLLTDSLTPIGVIQHLIGLGLAVVCYLFLRRRGLPGWGATLAVLPLLLDPLQLVLEHYVLSDLLFEALLVAACLALLWQPRPGLRAVVAAGALVAAAGLVRGAGSFLLVAFVVAAVCLRLRWTKVLALVAAAVVPLAGYAVAFHHQYGEYAVADSGPRFLYARLAPFVDCHDPQLELPRYERMLCPAEPVGQRPDTDFYMWGDHRAAQWHVVPPPGTTQLAVVKDFDRHVVRAEPLEYSRAVLRDLAGGFMPSRTFDVPGYPASYWLFADHYWSLDRFIARHQVSPSRLDGTSYDPAAARFMTAYRQWVYTPGPLLAVLLLVAGAAVLGLGRSRRSGDRVAVGLLAGTCLLTLLTGAALSGFSWRYQLPQIPLLPMAGALGLAALVRGRAAGRPEPAPPLRVLDRAAGRLDLLLRPAAWRPAADRLAGPGLLPAALGVLAGAVAALLVGGLAVASGWFRPGPAAAVGAAAGVSVLVTLLVARSRARRDLLADDEVGTGAPGPDGPPAT